MSTRRIEAGQSKRKPMTQEEILGVLGVPTNIPGYSPESVWMSYANSEIHSVGARRHKTGKIQVVLGKRPDSLFFHMVVSINESVLVVFDDANLNTLQRVYKDILAAPTFLESLRRIKKAMQLFSKVGVYPLLPERG
jgi:hypothetical protein